MEKFYSPTGRFYTYSQLLKEIIDYIKDSPNFKYKIIIGTDSMNRETTDFVSAIIIYRLYHGGRFFWKRINYNYKIKDLRKRIYEEAMLSLKLAQEILFNLSKEKDIRFDFEIHVDIGNNGPTKEMLQEVIGMIRGSGFEVKIKPEAFGASKVADKYT
ncbi:MAG: ribonuclease H-like YkuK family protein [Candidatus Paceibacterota bacterium]